MNEQDTNLATIQTDIKYIQRDLGEIKQSIKESVALNISRREFDDYCKNTDKKIEGLASKEEFEFYKKIINSIGLAVLAEAVRLLFSYFHK